MITRSISPTQPPRWASLLAQGVRDPVELLALLGLDPAQAPYPIDAHSPFPLRVPRGFVARMRRGDWHDPLLRQVLPLAAEGTPSPGFLLDPVGDGPSRRPGGILHKYHGRALMVLTGACAIHCRYCFRRHFPYAEAHAARSRWTEALDYLRADPSIEEVILSGGDPLSLPDEKLAELTHALADIPHLKRLRLHTRLPIVLPERIDGPVSSWLGNRRFQWVIVVHSNHAREIDASVSEALLRMKRSGAVMLNQAVLLAGVNDTVAAQIGLSERLFESGVLPYYLHLLDRTQGTAHFEVGEDAARRLMGGMAGRLPGYLVPRLARETPGASAKRVLAPS
ncbi:MAG TPA: EF-P beta-lysylation protein EpmB [Candidatus Macondimonas sp.]|nr:EF-P beta-lysylation protein EpmB [Candidatus Macondimonas sp.]